MKQYFINKNSDKLLLFFTGWGCDESEFDFLDGNCDVLILYEYFDLNLNFDFSKYKKINLIAFSAGVFIASIFNFDVVLNKKIAISGNPYLFDENLGLSQKMQDVLYNVTEENADDFAKRYLIKTEEESKKFHHSQRTIESCKAEFDSLKKIYQKQKQNIKDIFNIALFGDDDFVFNISAQKEFYGERLFFIKNARHNIFFRFEKYEQLFNFNDIK